MGFHQDLRDACGWLVSVQRPDGGWGLTGKHPSSIVNTAEALLVLERAGGHLGARERGLSFVIGSLPAHIADTTDHGARTRYATFALAAFAGHADLVAKERVAEWTTWLLAARNPDSGWGTEARVEPSLVFPSATALWALQQVGCSEQELEASLDWLLNHSMETGWALRPGQGPPTPIATAYAVLCLGRSGRKDDKRVVAGAKLLLQTAQWGIHEDDVAGALWKHCTFAWVLPALMAVGEDPYSPVVAQGIRYVNTLKAAHGGWHEGAELHDRTVRAQFWAAMALGAVHDAFDPAVHVPRIDAERAQESLSEPGFVKIAVRSKWAVILPSALYKVLTYGLMVFGVLVLGGAHRKLAELPKSADLAITVALAFLFWRLVRTRPKQFPRLAPLLSFVLVVIEGVHLVWGTDVMAWLEHLQAWLRSMSRG